MSHLPGKSNDAADAASRYLSRSTIIENMDDHDETVLLAGIRKETKVITSISWSQLAAETNTDPTMKTLMDAVENGFQPSDGNLPNMAGY